MPRVPGDVMATFFDYVGGQFRRASTSRVVATIGMDGPPANPDRDYLQVQLSEMVLKNERDWFKTRWPALAVMVRCDFEGPRVLANVVNPRDVFNPVQGTGLVIRDVSLTPIIPFLGGRIEISAILQAMTVTNHLEGFLTTLSGFAKQLVVPQLSSALAVTEPLALGVQHLFTDGDGAILAYQQSFSAMELKSGYVALVNATPKQVPAGKLSVAENHLILDGQDVPFDYFLLRLNVFPSRDDYQKIGSIMTPFQAAIKHLSKKKHDDAADELRAAHYAVAVAPELSNSDRERVALALSNRYDAVKSSLGRVGMAKVALPPFNLSKAVNALPKNADRKRRV